MGAQNRAQGLVGGLFRSLAAARLGLEGPAFQGSTARDELVSYLLDTNVLSEWTKPKPNAGVIEWLSQVDEEEVFLSVVTFAELRHGIERLPAGTHRRHLDEWLRGDLPLRFEGRIVLVDGAIADEWGRLVARREARGRPIQAMDALIAATAEVHDLTLVTRNTSDFQGSVKSILNPWT